MVPHRADGAGGGRANPGLKGDTTKALRVPGAPPGPTPTSVATQAATTTRPLSSLEGRCVGGGGCGHATLSQCHRRQATGGSVMRTTFMRIGGGEALSWVCPGES